MSHWTRAFENHRRLQPHQVGSRYIGECKCGWQSKSKFSRAIANRSVGLHVSAAIKRADKKDDEAIKAHYANKNANHAQDFVGCEHPVCVAAGSIELTKLKEIQDEALGR